MRAVTKRCVLCLSAVITCVPVQARADGYVAPWIGANAASSTDDGRGVFGVTMGYMATGLFGFEADVGYSPEFFGSTNEFGSVTGITVMGNAILGIPIGGDHGAGIRPYVSGGFGLMRTHTERGSIVDQSRSTNEFGYDLGGGMMGFFNQHIGLRGDLRYLRTLEDTNRGSGTDFAPGRLRYWRATVGLTFR
jgi:Outer membrane protein beta-barrel domain